MNSMADQFIQALKEAEQTMQPLPVAALFSKEADLSNLAHIEANQDQQDAQTFWADYLSVFQQIRSEFTNVIEADHAVVLEWVSEGVLRSGEPIRYRGVSILGSKDSQIQRFRTYYDSAAFVPGGAKHQPV